jgi:large subunit ribosomal protein L21
MYALVEIKGRQYKAEKGTLLKIDRLDKPEGEKVEFNSVMFISGDKGKVQIGTPYIKGVTVKATIENHVRDKKIIVFKYRPKKGYRRKKGHRQQYTMIRVEDIAGL